MRKFVLSIILTTLFTLLWVGQTYAGDLPVDDVGTIRMLIVQPDVDMSVFDGEQLCTALMEIIDNYDGDLRDRYVKAALGWLRVTEDERSVEYLVEYLDEFPMNCLHGLGHFSTVESCNALKGYLNDEDEFNRRFAAESLGKLDFTVSDEMWVLRDGVISLLSERYFLEEKEWILSVIDESIVNIESQTRDEDSASFDK